MAPPPPPAAAALPPPPHRPYAHPPPTHLPGQVFEDAQVAFRSGDTANSLMVITKGTAKFTPRVGLRKGSNRFERELGVGDVVAAGTAIQESLLQLLHAQHAAKHGECSGRLECLTGNSHTGSVQAVRARL